MLLDTIDSPADLKALPAEELPRLAEEIRAFIVEAVARTGGHLGPNLGVVELTLALHRVLDSPEDILLWDTGHQAYVHKLLTGRREAFATLRQPGGLSGYPNRGESAHDWIENSHASTALSYAFGLAAAQAARPSDRRRRVVAVVGDGALTGGMAYEALNNLGHAGLPVLAVLNDNGRSYAETVSFLSERVTRVRLDPRYRSLRARLDRLLAHIPGGGRVADGGFEALKTISSGAPNLQHFVEALGVRYAGPVDGHDLAALQRALSRVVDAGGPVLLHVLTDKGKGYRPAETDREKKLHDTSAFDVATGAPTRRRDRSYTEVFADTLVALAEAHPELVAITAAMPGSTGLLALADAHPGRVIDVGIAEQHATTAAAGLAMGGMLPVVAVYSTFLARALDQANLDVGLHDQHVVFCLDRAGITGADGPSHHGILDLALCLRIPTMTVLAPSSGPELEAMLTTAVEELAGPVAIRYPKGAAGSREPVGEGLAARRVRAGEQVCLLAVGDRLAAALAAAGLLAREGVEAAVWDVRCVRPADEDMIAAACTFPLVVTVENGILGGGAGAELADRIVERAGPVAAPPVLRLGVPAAYIPHGSVDQILAELGLDGPGIAAAALKALED